MLAEGTTTRTHPHLYHKCVDEYGGVCVSTSVNSKRKKKKEEDVLTTPTPSLAVQATLRRSNKPPKKIKQVEKWLTAKRRRRNKQKTD